MRFMNKKRWRYFIMCDIWNKYSLFKLNFCFLQSKETKKKIRMRHTLLTFIILLKIHFKSGWNSFFFFFWNIIPTLKCYFDTPMHFIHMFNNTIYKIALHGTLYCYLLYYWEHCSHQIHRIFTENVVWIFTEYSQLFGNVCDSPSQNGIITWKHACFELKLSISPLISKRRRQSIMSFYFSQILSKELPNKTTLATLFFFFHGIETEEMTLKYKILQEKKI